MQNKRIVQMLMLGLFSLLCWYCGPSNNRSKVVREASIPTLLTHKEAADTLRADTSKPLQPIRFLPLETADAAAVLATTDLAPQFVGMYPENGFYGDDRYRIEFIFTEMIKDAKDPSLYRVKGKNRFKKTISSFSGTMKIGQLRAFVDPNLDTSEIANLGYERMFTAAGTFELFEDSTLNTSGFFRGTFQTDFGKLKDGTTDLWFYTDETATKGCGFLFDGYWTSYKNATNSKPVIWSRDIFRIGNDILKDFSYGERDVEINPAYRNLGWDNFWDGEEWWNDAPKKEM
jgi:hypothetical protein